MTKQTWNQQEIETANTKCTSRLDYDKNESVDINELIAELNKPKWTPQSHEVYYHEQDGSYYKTSNISSDYHADIIRRPLIPDEVPALKVAIEALKQVTHGNKSDDIARKQGAIEALTKIKELTNV